MISPLRFSAASCDVVLTEAQFTRIAAILQDRSGIVLMEDAQKLVISRLAKHLRRLGHRDFGTYLKLVTSSEGAAELEQMINALTTNTTRFYREPDHFACFAQQALPRLIRSAREGKRVRMWSAACSSGEEAYSIAATVLEAFPDAARYDVQILATDINRQMLARAQIGLYDVYACKNLEPKTRALLFEAEERDGCFRIRSPLRDLVIFKYLNFVEDWPVSGPFDVIFCRNVAIYLDPATQSKLWTGLERVLDKNGLLFIGHSERIGPSLSHKLELFAPTSFRRPEAQLSPSISRHKEHQDVSQELH